MRLSHALASHVSLRIRSRGAEYFASGAVVRIQRHDGIIRATVRGADDYSVWIEPVGPLLRSACTCPDFVDRLEICKHVWAAILTAEARGIPLLDTGHTPDQIDLEPMDLDDPYGEDEEAWRDQDERSHPAQAALPRKPRDTPVWRQFLDAIAASPNAPAGLAGPGVRESQLLYVLDISASLAAGTVVVELMTRDRKANGEWGKPRAIRMTAADVRLLPPGADRHILERLLGGRPHFDGSPGYGEFGELSRFRLQGVLVGELLPLLCRDNRCLARVGAPGQTSTPPALSRAAGRSGR